MNCYDFELNISAYIDGEIKQKHRQEFIKHQSVCSICDNKLSNISEMLSRLPKLNNLKTSESFDSKLESKIHKINNKDNYLWNNIFNTEPFGIKYPSLLGFAAAIVIIFGSTYILINQESLPDINFNKISSKSDNLNSNYRPTVVNPQQNQPSIADSDTSIKTYKNNNKTTEKRIQLVRGK